MLAFTREVLGIAQEDEWVSSEDVRLSGQLLEQAGASVSVHLAAPGAHGIRALERLAAREILTGRPAAGHAVAEVVDPGVMTLEKRARPLFGEVAEARFAALAGAMNATPSVKFSK